MNSFRLLRWLLPAAIVSIVAVAQAGPLHDAARSGAINQVKTLLKQGADVNAVDRYGFTPRLLARLNGHRSVARLLAKHGGRTGLKSLVRQLQEQLVYLGYPAGTIDGRLGPQTRRAIRRFQRHIKVAASARIGEAWVAVLHRHVVQRVQRQLKHAGLYHGPVHGRLGAKAIAAIRRYQQDNRLAPTGQLSAELLESLAAGAAVSRAVDSNPSTLSKQALIKATQYELNRMGYEAGPIDGRLGSKTVAAIDTFQRQQGMHVTGKPSPALLKRLRATGPDQASVPPDRGQHLPKGNNEIRGPLKLEIGSNNQLLGCAIKNVQLDRSWCRPFVNNRPSQIQDCRAIIRADGQVLMVKCRS